MQKTALEVIRHSLNAAQAALSLIDSAPTAQHSILETVPFINSNEVIEKQAQPVRTPLELLMKELNDPRYKLRTIKELKDNLGFDPRDVLTNGGVTFVLKNRRADGAPLIGLASRN